MLCNCSHNPCALGRVWESFNGAEVAEEVAALTQQARRLSAAIHIEPIQHPFTTDIVRDAHGMLAMSHIGAVAIASNKAWGGMTRHDIEHVT